MSDSSVQTDKPCIEQKGTLAVDSACKVTKSLSMHEDVPVWYDCCSCEAEPYWVETLGEPPGPSRDEPESTG
jgi:hypothetical protein